MDKNFNVYFRDIIVAHVPREKFSYPNGKKIDNGKIEEYNEEQERKKKLRAENAESAIYNNF